MGVYNPSGPTTANPFFAGAAASGMVPQQGGIGMSAARRASDKKEKAPVAASRDGEEVSEKGLRSKRGALTCIRSGRLEARFCPAESKLCTTLGLANNKIDLRLSSSSPQAFLDSTVVAIAVELASEQRR